LRIATSTPTLKATCISPPLHKAYSLPNLGSQQFRMPLFSSVCRSQREEVYPVR
jgi:hypothetical protein